MYSRWHSIAPIKALASQLDPSRYLHLISPHRDLCDHLLHSAEVLRLVRGKKPVRLLLRRRGRVGVVEEVLDAEKDLADGDCWLPILVLVQDAQAHGARRVDV